MYLLFILSLSVRFIGQKMMQKRWPWDDARTKLIEWRHDAWPKLSCHSCLVCSTNCRMYQWAFHWNQRSKHIRNGKSTLVKKITKQCLLKCMSTMLEPTLPYKQWYCRTAKETHLPGKGSRNHVRSCNWKEHEHVSQIIAHNCSWPCSSILTIIILIHH